MGIESLFVLVLVGVGFLCAIIAMMAADSDKIDAAHVWLVLAFAFTFFAFLGLADESNEKYKQGQIDAMNGDIKFERVIETKTDTLYKRK